MRQVGHLPEVIARCTVSKIHVYLKIQLCLNFMGNLVLSNFLRQFCMYSTCVLLLELGNVNTNILVCYAVSVVKQFFFWGGGFTLSNPATRNSDLAGLNVIS